MALHRFTEYAHQQWNEPDTVEILVDSGLPEDVATKLADEHEPLYEVAFDFEYDPDAETLRCVEVRFNDSGQSGGEMRSFRPVATGEHLETHLP